MNILIVPCYNETYIPHHPVTSILANGFSKLRHIIIETEMHPLYHINRESAKVHSMFASHLPEIPFNDCMVSDIDLIIVSSYRAQLCNTKKKFLEEFKCPVVVIDESGVLSIYTENLIFRPDIIYYRRRPPNNSAIAVSTLLIAGNDDYTIFNQHRNRFAVFIGYPYTKTELPHYKRLYIKDLLELFPDSEYVYPVSVEEYRNIHADSLVCINSMAREIETFRMWEILCAGGCLLTEDILDDLNVQPPFKPFYNLLTFSPSIDELYNRLSWCRDNYNQTMQIAKMGFDFLKQHHLSQNRALQVLGDLDLL